MIMYQRHVGLALYIEIYDSYKTLFCSFSRAGDMYSSYFEISVSQHDVLRDLAIHMSNCERVNQRKRLLMPRRETGLPKEWERHMDQPFNAQIVSLHTGIVLVYYLYFFLIDYLQFLEETLITPNLVM